MLVSSSAATAFLPLRCAVHETNGISGAVVCEPYVPLLLLSSRRESFDRRAPPIGECVHAHLNGRARGGKLCFQDGGDSTTRRYPVQGCGTNKLQLYTFGTLVIAGRSATVAYRYSASFAALRTEWALTEAPLLRFAVGTAPRSFQ